MSNGNSKFVQINMKDTCIDEIRSLCNIVERWIRLDILSLKSYPTGVPGFVAYLIKGDAFNDLCVKTLCILSF